MGHYASEMIDFDDEKRRREEAVNSHYEYMKKRGCYTDDKIKDALTYLLERDAPFGSTTVAAEVHIRRLKGELE